jgi:hypothetical protein
MFSKFKSSPKKVPLGQRSNAPIASMVQGNEVRGASKRRYTRAQEVNALAIRNYKVNGRGITYHDLISSGLAEHKFQAQNTLKRCLARNILFTAGNHKPQLYLPSSLKAEILKARLSKNASEKVTEVPSYKSLLGLDPNTIVTQTLENFLLPILPKLAASIHKIQLKVKLNPEYYKGISVLAHSENRGKEHEEIVASVLVRYFFYPNGRVTIFVACSETPFKLESDDDVGRLIAFLGVVRDRLVVFLHDIHERAIPDIMQWYLTECDINRDVKIGDWLQFTGLNIQVRHAFHLFRIYIKAKGQDTLCRVEESIILKNKPVLEAITEIFNPTERLEKQVAELDNKVSQLLEFFGPNGYEHRRGTHTFANLGFSDKKRS